MLVWQHVQACMGLLVLCSGCLAAWCRPVHVACCLMHVGWWALGARLHACTCMMAAVLRCTDGAAQTC